MNPQDLYANISQYEIIGWMDSKPEFWGQEKDGFKIYAPSQFDKLQYDKVIVCAASSTGTRAIANYLRAQGVAEDKICTEYVLKETQMPVATVWNLQYFRGSNPSFETFNRMNLLIHYAFVKQFFGQEIWAYDLAERYMKCVCEDGRETEHTRYYENLLQDMEQKGYADASNISMNRKGFMVDGTHRLAYLLWKGASMVGVDVLNSAEELGDLNRDLNWILSKSCFTQADVELLHRMYDEICDKYKVDREEMGDDIWEMI